MSAKTPDEPCRVTLSLSQEEADCLLHLLMLAEPSQEIPGAIADRLLCRIAEAQRTLNRQKLSHADTRLHADALAG